METKKKVYDFRKKFVSYGHWEITLKIDNPKYDADDEDSDEDERIEIDYVTTNSIAIDNGNMRSLAEECLIKNGFNDEEFDLSDIPSGFSEFNLETQL